MRIRMLLLVSLLLPYSAGPGAAQEKASGTSSQTPTYTAEGRLMFPTQYREWVYLTSGVDMSYSPTAMDHTMFDNVFVNPDAYRAFLETGTWPDKTMLVLEARMAGSKASINKSGHYQTGEVMGREVHVKDSARGGWAFFGFDGDGPAKMISKEASCYSCHEQHAAVDTTFVQFYPTLIDVAKSKGTLSQSYLKEEAARAEAKGK
jgi:hypothetical protein